ncbi:hypothetical protein, partial [Ralstonia pseudosolanacearum]|uniref:hypothetical protein n=1 Tax=Ralstonia pseudosolanacearum TaxID=1310165 RepID=UPI0026744397
FIADLLSCHANNNAQPPAFDDLVLLDGMDASPRQRAGPTMRVGIRGILAATATLCQSGDVK